MMRAAGTAWFAAVQQSFEHANRTGVVQVVVEGAIPEEFYITVKHDALVSADTCEQEVDARIRVKQELLEELVRPATRQVFDERVVEYSSRFMLSGDEALARDLLHLAKTPSAQTQALFGAARERWQGRPLASVERVDRPSKEIVLRAANEFLPILMTGALDHWDVASWSFARLKERYGRLKLNSYATESIAEFVTRITAGATPADAASAASYTRGSGLPGYLWKAFEPPIFAHEEGLFDFPQLWLGSAPPSGPITSLHCDAAHSFLAQVISAKRVLLYSPDQEDKVYAERAYNMYRNCFGGPNDPRYPRFLEARALEVTIAPGEILLIPAGWFHTVFVSEPTMSVSFPASADKVRSAAVAASQR